MSLFSFFFSTTLPFLYTNICSKNFSRKFFPCYSFYEFALLISSFNLKMNKMSSPKNFAKTCDKLLGHETQLSILEFCELVSLPLTLRTTCLFADWSALQFVYFRHWSFELCRVVRLLKFISVFHSLSPKLNSIPRVIFILLPHPLRFVLSNQSK